MNVIERQTELTKLLYSINSAAIKEFASQQKANVEKYMATNKSFGEKLPDIKGVTELFSLQREYGESLWANAKTAFETQNDLVKATFEETRGAFKVAITAEKAMAASVEATPVKAEAAPAKIVAKKTKAKPKAKKTAE